MRMSMRESSDTQSLPVLLLILDTTNGCYYPPQPGTAQFREEGGYIVKGPSTIFTTDPEHG